jgi:hypothetical protein
VSTAREDVSVFLVGGQVVHCADVVDAEVTEAGDLNLKCRPRDGLSPGIMVARGQWQFAESRVVEIEESK